MRRLADKRPPLLVIFLMAAFLLVVAALLINYWHDSKSVRYRLTYYVEVDGQIRSGSGVVEVGSQVTGEAILVDLGEGRYLFSLLGGRRIQLSSWATHRTSPDKLIWLAFDCGGWGSELYRCLNSTRPSVDLRFELLPALATFGNINDPNTIMLVDPNDLEVHFGPEIMLKRATIEITSDPVTQGRIEKILTWLTDWDGYAMTPEKRIMRLDFVR